MVIYGAGSLEDIKQCTLLGCEGILTNPQGFDQYYEGKMTLEEITEAIAGATDLPFYIQVHGPTSEALVERARKLHKISPNTGFKIISDEKGFWAIRQLQKEGIDCIATALFSMAQAAVASTVGAFGICPFISRSREIGIDPHQMLRSIKEGYAGHEKPPRIVAVSLRTVADVEAVLAAGADAVAIRYPLIREMMEHPLSKKAEVLFGKNWSRVKGEDVRYLTQSGSHEGEAE